MGFMCPSPGGTKLSGRYKAQALYTIIKPPKYSHETSGAYKMYEIRIGQAQPLQLLIPYQAGASTAPA
jgi:hypothetical protein